MVQDIEIYGDVIKVILKPTKKFPNGYFYTDNNPIALSLVKSYSWYLATHGKNTCISAHKYIPNTGNKKILYHQEYAYKILGYYPVCIDHINLVEIDNRNENLNVVTAQQNLRNRPTIGYAFDARHNYFQPNYVLNSKNYTEGSYKTEFQALLATNQLRKLIFNDYDYNFYLDRRNDEDILDAELTKKITTQQAIYYHVKRYVENNPWYAYRYNLFEYCRQHNINIPSFKLDNQGFMIHPVTGERLCPY